MGSKSKIFAIVMIVIMAFSSLIIFGSMPFGFAQSGTTVSSQIISSDTTWNKANSPYMLISSVIVSSGATLTIQPGVTVDIAQDNNLQIDGALNATGSKADNIQFIGAGSLILDSCSLGWNQTTGSGCIIECAKISLYSFTICCSAKINDNTIICGIYPWGGSPQIINNNVVGQIWGNESVQSPLILNNTVRGCIYIPAGSPVISQNVVTGVEGGTTNGSSYIPSSLCTAIMGGPGSYGTQLNAVITDNTITCGLDGISWGGGEEATIENNFIANCSRYGMMVDSTAFVENNTLVNNVVGLLLSNFNSGIYTPIPTPPIIRGNNILNSSKYNIYSYCSMNLTATYNWWGTTDPMAIAQTVYDHTFDSNLGTITCIPCLTQANPLAYPNPSAPLTYPVTTNTPTQAPTPTSTDNNTSTETTSTNYFSIDSNSTVTDLTFNSTNSHLSFTLSGPTGTAGYAKVTIAKILMPNGNLEVFMDETQIPSLVNSNGSYWIITFNYHHSTHRVIINSIDRSQLNPVALGQYQLLILGAIIVALTAFGGLIFYVTKKKEKI